MRNGNEPEDGGPWGRQTPKPSRIVPHSRVLLWLGLVAVVVASLFGLAKLFPGAANSGDDWFWIARGVGVVALLLVAVLSTGRIQWAEKARHGAIWVGIVAALVVVFAYRNEFEGIAQRVQAEFGGAYPVATGARELVVSESAGGGYFVMGQVNGQTIRFLVDTGATDTVLSPADARRLGIVTEGLHFDHAAETANGVGYGAAYVADNLAIGPIRFANLPMLINQTSMSSSLLGLTFLSRLESFQVKGHKLYLTWKD